MDVLTSAYLEKHYIGKRDLDRGGRFVDTYECVSVPFVARLDEVAVGSIRLIVEEEDLGLPVKSAFVLKDGLSTASGMELSQLAVANGHRNDHRIMLALIKRAIDYCKAREVDTWYAAVDARLLSRMRQMGFVVAPIGEPRHYLGSHTTPVFLSLTASLAFLKTTNPAVHEFFESGPGTVSWYRDGASPR